MSHHKVEVFFSSLQNLLWWVQSPCSLVSCPGLWQLLSLLREREKNMKMPTNAEMFHIFYPFIIDLAEICKIHGTCFSLRQSFNMVRIKLTSLKPFWKNNHIPHKLLKEQNYFPVYNFYDRNRQGAPGWLRQLCPTSAQVMISQFLGSSPTSSSVLTAQSLEPASDSVCLSVSLKNK